VGLLNSAPSMTPRSSAGTISPPGRITTLAPSSLNSSADRPTVRYLVRWSCSGRRTGLRNQPRGWVGMGPCRKEMTFILSSFCSRFWYMSNPPP
jgi:hypothetical protein